MMIAEAVRLGYKALVVTVDAPRLGGWVGGWVWQMGGWWVCEWAAGETRDAQHVLPHSSGGCCLLLLLFRQQGG